MITIKNMTKSYLANGGNKSSTVRYEEISKKNTKSTKMQQILTMEDESNDITPTNQT